MPAHGASITTAAVVDEGRDPQGPAGVSHWLDTWLPPRCVAWDTPLSPGEPLPFGAAAAETLLRAEPSADAATDSLASFQFGGALRDAIVAAKYLPDERRARRLARFWGDHLAQHPLAVPDGTEAVTFVPSHWRRRLWRGFDFSPLLAEAIAAQLRLPVVDTLRCSRHEAPLSAAQSRQQRETRAGGRYELRVAAEAIPRKLVLVDDVVTTGATLRAARAPLEQAGAELAAVALARTPA
jgi:predicted amidophosphoribosyltransferase